MAQDSFVRRAPGRPLTGAAAVFMLSITGAAFVVSTMSKNLEPAGPTTLPLSTTIHRSVVSCRIWIDGLTPGVKVRLDSVGLGDFEAEGLVAAGPCEEVAEAAAHLAEGQVQVEEERVARLVGPDVARPLFGVVVAAVGQTVHRAVRRAVPHGAILAVCWKSSQSGARDGACPRVLLAHREHRRAVALDLVVRLPERAHALALHDAHRLSRRRGDVVAGGEVEQAVGAVGGRALRHAEDVGQLDTYNRQMGNYELLPGSNS